MKTLKTDPGAKRLMESLRNMGYDCATAIADIVDNSISADASEIYIDIIPKQDARLNTLPKQDFHPAAIIIADNGKGMDRDELHEAMRFGTLQEHSLSDLGKYGLGLKTASLSQCRVLTVTSKAKSASGIRPRRHCMRWDIDHVYETNDWELLVPENDEFDDWEKSQLNIPVAQENGTVVLWTNLDGALSLLSSSNPRDRERLLAHLITKVGGHLRMIFHRFMQGSVTGRRKLNIYLCGELLAPWDPFCRSESTKELDILRLPIIITEPDGSKLEEIVTISPFVLPHQNEFSSYLAWKEASGQKNWNHMQGFYFYRNSRLLQVGGWNRIKSADEHTKLLRVAVDFPGELDRTFAINITKMRASIPAEIRDDIESNVSGWIKVARDRYDNPPTKTGNTSQIIHSEPDADPATSQPTYPIKIPGSVNSEPLNVFQNELDGILVNNKGRWELRNFSDTLIKILDALSEGKIKIEQIPLQLIKKIYRDEI